MVCEVLVDRFVDCVEVRYGGERGLPAREEDDTWDCWGDCHGESG